MANSWKHEEKHRPSLAADTGSDLARAPFDPRRVMVLVGPTSSGKTALSIALAKEFDLEVVCMDSMQIYRELKVGTARPSPEDYGDIPHHLFGAFSVAETMSAYRYGVEASHVIAQIQARGRIPLLVGGTGLYLRALFERMANLPQTPPELRTRLERSAQKHGPGWIVRLLRRLDPAAADHLHPNDSQRLMRFLEVRLMTGRSMLDFWAEQGADTSEKPLTLGLQMERPLLDARIHQAVGEMLSGGWVEETESLIRQNLYIQTLKIGPIGYAQVADLIAGKISREDAHQQIYLATRRYAKRQMTWFRKASYIRWFPFLSESGYNTSGITEVVKGNMG